MAQLLLPLLPTGATAINDILSVRNENGSWYYFAGISPIFSHNEKDMASFRMFTSQLIVSGQCRNINIIKAFGVSSNSVWRSVKKYKEGGIKAFFQARRGRGGSVISGEVKKGCQELLDKGWSRNDICEKLAIKYDTLRKAIASGRLHELNGNLAFAKRGSSKSERTVEDAKAGAGMGAGCTRTVERTLAAMGKLNQASVKFENCLDLSNKKANHLPPMNSRSPNRHLILSTLKILIKRIINSMRSSILELPRLENVVHKIGKATPGCTMPKTWGLIFSFPDFQFVRSKDKSHLSSLIGRNRTMSVAILSMEKSKPAKKRCKRLYSDSVQALPGIATAIFFRFTVRILSNAIMKKDSKSALALFHPRREFKILLSFEIWFIEFTPFMAKSCITS